MGGRGSAGGRSGGGNSTKVSLKKMTNEQLKTYYDKTFKEGIKAFNSMQKSKDETTKTKYEDIYNEKHRSLWQVELEKHKRGLDKEKW